MRTPCCSVPTVVTSELSMTQILGQGEVAPVHWCAENFCCSDHKDPVLSSQPATAATPKSCQFGQQSCFISVYGFWFAIADMVLGFLCLYKVLGLWFYFQVDLDVLKYSFFAEFLFIPQNERASHTPQENRGSVSHPCCLLCSAVKKEKLALGSCLGSPKSSASQALHAAPFTFSNWAIKDFVF